MGITVKETSREFSTVEQYLMTLNPSITSLKDVVDGTSIDVAGYIVFDDEKDNGEVCEIMSIITPDNEVYSCQSATFKKGVKNIATIMQGKPFAVIKTSGKTKAGRDYIDCILDISKVDVK